MTGSSCCSTHSDAVSVRRLPVPAGGHPVIGADLETIDLDVPRTFNPERINALLFVLSETFAKINLTATLDPPTET